MTPTNLPATPRRPFLETLVALLAAEFDSMLTLQAVTSFSETAHYPAGLWVSLPAGSPLAQTISQAGSFSLSLLSKRQRQLAERYADAVTAAPPDPALWMRSPSGFLFLKGALAASGCRLARQVSINGCLLLIAAIQEGVIDSQASLHGPLLSSEL